MPIPPQLSHNSLPPPFCQCHPFPSHFPISSVVSLHLSATAISSLHTPLLSPFPTHPSVPMPSPTPLFHPPFTTIPFPNVPLHPSTPAISYLHTFLLNPSPTLPFNLSVGTFRLSFPLQVPRATLLVELRLLGQILAHVCRRQRNTLLLALLRCLQSRGHLCQPCGELTE